MDDLIERLKKPVDADAIYDWIIQKREETSSDLPRLGFANSMELIDEERAEAAARIATLEALVKEAGEAAAEHNARHGQCCNVALSALLARHRQLSAAAERAMTGWQPIETAPRDQMILGYADGMVRLIMWEANQWVQVGATIEAGWFLPEQWKPIALPADAIERGEV